MQASIGIATRLTARLNLDAPVIRGLAVKRRARTRVRRFAEELKREQETDPFVHEVRLPAWTANLSDTIRWEGSETLMKSFAPRIP